MKFRVISDLHVEFYAHPLYLQRKLNKLYPSIDPDEVLIVAGDLGVAGSGLTCYHLREEYKSMLHYFAKKWNCVILVPGNHEYYERDRLCKLEDIDTMIQKECNKLGIIFLNKNIVKIEDKKEDIYILGCTLWSEATPQAYKGMNDKLKAILSHSELIKTHTSHKDWLQKEITRVHRLKETNLSKKKRDSKIIVITHHLPLMELTHPKYTTPEYKPLNSAYASDLSLLIESTNPYVDKKKHCISHWFCGHTHEMTRKTFYDIDFFINPMGYPRESRVTKTEAEIIIV
jgi:hypothetical protein